MEQITTPKTLFVEIIEIMTFPMSLLCVELTTDFTSAALVLHTLVSCKLHESLPQHHQEQAWAVKVNF